MSTVNVLIVVDVEGALATNLGENVYLVDTHKNVGSGSEGQQELQTACKDGDQIRWRVVSVAPDNDIEIVRFTGQMIDDRACVPKAQGSSRDAYWAGYVETQGSDGSQQYSVVLSTDGREMTFDPWLVVKG